MPNETEDQTEEVEAREDRPEHELRTLAADIYDGKVYGSWMFYRKKPSPNDIKVPKVIYISGDQKLITPDELQKQATWQKGHPDYEVDIERINCLWMPLMFLTSEQLHEMAQTTLHVYSYMTEMNPSDRLTNGLPHFFSLHQISHSEWRQICVYIQEYAEVKEKYFGSAPKPPAELPATIQLRFYRNHGDGLHSLLVWIYPVKALAADGYTLITGYRDGIDQNKEISFGADHASVRIEYSDDPAPEDENIPVAEPRKKSAKQRKKKRAKKASGS